MQHPHRPIAIAGVAILATATLVSPALAASQQTSSTSSHKTWWVSPGTGTISQAVVLAKPGDTLRLKAGTFRDSVQITKTLKIQGAGWSKTIIKPPAHSNNPCNADGAVEGICVLGVLDSKGNPDLTQPVKNVRISYLRLTGFNNGVFGFNTKGLKVHGVRADHNAEYGIARFASTHSSFTRNRASWNAEAGLYLGDSPKAASVVWKNETDHNGIGVFLRDSTGITASHNKTWGNCIGILALNDGGAPTGNMWITHNKVSANNKECPPVVEDQDHIPGYSGLGIALAGVHDVVVTKNAVKNHHSSKPSDLPKGGIVVFSTAFLGGADPTNNIVAKNHLSNNAPADIFWDGKGSGNVVRHNHCHTAIPGNLGWCTS